jgi:hypothetical protein
MPDSTREARGRRSEARERRRSGGSESPVEELEQTPPTPETNGNMTGTAAKVVGTALAAGLLGAVAGAAKAYLDRRDQPSEPEDSEPEHGEADARAEPEPEEPEPASDASAEAPTRDEEPTEAEEPEPEARAEPQPEEPEPEGAEDPGESEDEDSGAEVRGVAEGEAAEVVDNARRQLEGLLGTGVERVSGLDQADGNWRVRLEAVEVHRVPESTDVMASYEVMLDDDGKLVSVNRKRRYRRSQVDEQS